jgi:nicotinamidase-related amidase
MALTKLDETCALIVIDLQKGLRGSPAVQPLNDIIERAARLASGFRERELPVVLVNVAGAAPGRTDAGRPKLPTGSEWSELVPELKRESTDHVITKHRWGAFHGTTLDEDLRRRGVTQVVMAGIATSIGVESTARSAFDLGYDVVLVLDAMTDRDADAQRNSAEKIFPRLGETALTDDVLKLLEMRSGT